MVQVSVVKSGLPGRLRFQFDSCISAEDMAVAQHRKASMEAIKTNNRRTGKVIQVGQVLETNVFIAFMVS
jgi:hypothetical protein